MHLSLKTISRDCLNKSPPLSIVKDIYGYSAPRRTLSLKKQLRLMGGLGLNVNLILVGGDTFTSVEIEEIEHGIQFCRDIFSNVNLCVRRVSWQSISHANSGSYETIDSNAEAKNLTSDFSGLCPDDLDVFVVRTIVGKAGWSPVNGCCSKGDTHRMTGVVIELKGIGSFNDSGNTFAHEIGHYLGLKHIEEEECDHSNDSINFITENSNSNTMIYEWQGQKMKAHCYIKNIY